MKLSCLKDYIGLTVSKLDTTVPESGLYINGQPGINLELIDSLADNDQRNYTGVWNDIQDRAIAQLSLDFAVRMRQRYRLKRINRSFSLGKNANKALNVAATAEYRGFTIETTFKNAFNLVYSNLQTVYINSVYLYLKAAAAHDITIKVADLDSGDEIESFTLAVADMVVGWNTILINRIYSNRRIFIAYDATEVNTYSNYINPNINGDFNLVLGSIYGSIYSRGFIRAAQTVDNDFSKDPVYGVNGHGFSGTFSLLCSYDQFICDNREEFQLPLLYQEAAQLLIECISSPRLNRFTTIDMEKADGQLQYFQDLYTKTLDDLADSITLNLKDVCLECNAPVTIIESHP